MQVPTIDTVRNSYVGSALVRHFAHTLVVGNVGVGKTMIIQVDVCVCSQLCVFATSLHTRWWWAMWE